jgi:hypothetical protein
MESSAPRPIADEVAALRAELNQVKEQLADLLRFITIEERDDGSKFLGIITCSVLNVCNPEKAGDTRVFICAGEDEAAVALWGSDHCARAMIRVDEGNRGSVVVQGREKNVAVELWADGDDHGQILVRSPEGNPRAGMKSMPGAGIVSVVADDGSVRAVMRSGEDIGEVAVALPGKILAKLHAGERGGLISCFGIDRTTPGVAMTTNGQGDGAILVNHSDGRTGATIACSGASTLVAVSGSGTFEDGDANSVRLFAHAAGSSIGLHNPAGEEVMRLITTEDGAAISLQKNSTDKPLASLQSSGENAFVSVKSGTHQGTAMLGTDQNGGYLITRSQDAVRSTTLKFDNGGGGLTFFSNMAESTAALTLGYTGDRHSTLQLYGPGGNEAPFVTVFTHEHGGSVLVHGSDGTRQAGLSAGEHGGKACVFSELGVERVILGAVDDGGALTLKWGGTNGLLACATERGGLVSALDPAGEVRAIFPDPEEFRDPDDSASGDVP